MCGIVGIISKNNKNILPDTVNALLKLQHRGQDASGICYIENNVFTLVKNEGLIKNLSINPNSCSNIAIAHTRYTTSGDISIKNAQPFLYRNAAIVHNGTIYNIEKFKKILLDNNFPIESDSDSEIILKWLFYKTNKQADLWTIKEIQNILNNDFNFGSYSIILLLKNRLIAAKDINSYRPLTFIETKNNYCFNSEDNINDSFINKFELSAGSILEIKQSGYKLLKYQPKTIKQCVFEPIYFANSKSNVFNTSVKNTRIKLGELLALQDNNIEADYIVPIMNSGFWGAVGYSKKSQIKLKILIKTKKEIYRTFIENSNKRIEKINKKFILNEKQIKGKNLIVVDDSIVRGTTSKKIIELLKTSGANKIHLRLTSPPIVNICKWGIDITKKNELLAYKLKTIDNIKKELDIDSVNFISETNFNSIFNNELWCKNCFIATKNQE